MVHGGELVALLNALPDHDLPPECIHMFDQVKEQVDAGACCEMINIGMQITVTGILAHALPTTGMTGDMCPTNILARSETYPEWNAIREAHNMVFADEMSTDTDGKIRVYMTPLKMQNGQDGGALCFSNKRKNTPEAKRRMNNESTIGIQFFSNGNHRLFTGISDMALIPKICYFFKLVYQCLADSVKRKGETISVKVDAVFIYLAKLAYEVPPPYRSFEDMQEDVHNNMRFDHGIMLLTHEKKKQSADFQARVCMDGDVIASWKFSAIRRGGANETTTQNKKKRPASDRDGTIKCILNITHGDDGLEDGFGAPDDLIYHLDDIRKTMFELIRATDA